MVWFIVGLGVGLGVAGAISFAVLSRRTDPWPEALPIVAFRVDDAGVVIQATPVATLLFGEQLVGRAFERVLPDWGALDAQRDEAWKHPDGTEVGRMWRLDARLPDDTPLPVRVHRAAVEHGGFLVCLEDLGSEMVPIERLTRANANLEQRIAEVEHASKAKSTYLAGVAQVLRTPLTTILGYGELVREELEDRELVELYQDVDRITAAAGALRTILEAVLDWTEIQAGRMSVRSVVFDVGDAVREVIEELRPEIEQGGNELVVDLPERMLVLGDDRRTQQIVRTLLINAAHHTQGGKVLVAAHRNDPHIHVVVGDTGEGMQPGELEELFVSFEQRASRKDAGRSELSLLLAHTFATMMGGRLRVSSEAGGGTDFTLSLPAHDDTEYTPPMLIDDL